jgi:methionyl-tRNA formyltransferase
MRLTYLGYDYFSPVLLYLLTRADITINRIITKPQLGDHVGRIAMSHNIPLIHNRISASEMAEYAADSDLILAASYGHRLAIPDAGTCHFLNLHPSLLPLARGPTSPYWTLTKYPESAGVTLHVMDENFDTGPIVSQTELAAPAGTSLEVYTHHANQAAIALLHDITLARLQSLRSNPQDDAIATYQPEFSESDRTITPDKTGAEITRLVAALGALGVYFSIEGARYIATQAQMIKGSNAPTLPFINDFYAYFPCADGVCLFPRHAVTQSD